MSKKANKKKILIVEDDKCMQDIYRNFLREYVGVYDMEIVDGGIPGYRELREKKYDLVILDVLMEDMSGDSLFALIANSSKNVDIPVIVVSVLSPKDSAITFILNRENTSYLSKPVTAEQLIHKIKEVLG
ncbi:MAG: response regulator [Candidatus Ancaeobacter aquaticus]|nr:response regulator [Candidatus Ancaeobacter aquaticus]